jgi:hypothetical protein
VLDSEKAHWFDQGEISLFLGGPPGDPNNGHVKCLPTFRLPLALREFSVVHSELCVGRICEISSPDRIDTLLSGFFDGMTEDEKRYYLNRFHMSNHGFFPHQFVAMAHDGCGNASVFDLDLLDERLDSQVADWDHEIWHVGQRRPFWSWFDEYVPSLLGLKVD